MKLISNVCGIADFGLFICPARYDVCCQEYRVSSGAILLELPHSPLGISHVSDMKFQEFRHPDFPPAATGLICRIISEDPNGMESW